MKTGSFLLALLVCCTSFLFGQDTKFTVSLSQNPVGTGEPFEITFSVNGNGERFTPPDFSGFQILSGPNTSTSMTMVNGSTSMSNAYSYDLIATREGEFTIGPATIISDGRKLSTTAIKIKVVKGKPVPKNSGNQGVPDDNQVTAGNTSDISKSLFIKAIVDKSNVYEGQQITLTYRLYTRVGIEQSQVDKLPDLNGFWNEDIKNVQQQVQWRIETYKGERFNVADIKQTILFPDHAGNLTIDPLGMTFLVRQPVPARDVMEQFFGAFKDVKYKVKSDPVTIHVKPLPENGKPLGFAGAVGTFNVAADLDKTSVKANDAINYKVKVSGRGNIKLLKQLNTSFPPDFEKYDPKITDSIIENENGVTGYRIYNYLLIPRHQGDFTIDPLKFSYFNPASGHYVTLSSKAFHVQVAKGANENNITAFSPDKEDVKVVDKDIRYIKNGDPGLTREDENFFGSAGFILLLLTGPTAFVAALYYRNLLRQRNSDLVKVKSRRAAKIAAQHLANAQVQLTAKNSGPFYEAVFKGLYGYLSDKLNISAAELDRLNITSALSAKGISDELITGLLSTLDLCEMARYAPVTHISPQEVYDKAKGIIHEIENKI